MEAWLLQRYYSIVLVGTSQTCRGCRENFSLPGRGAAPHTFQSSNHQTFQSANQPLPLCPLWLLVTFVINPHWQSCRRQPAPNRLQSVDYRRSFERSEETSAVPVAVFQRPATSSPEATARAQTSGAPPSFQTSKLPSFPGLFAASRKKPRRRPPGRVHGAISRVLYPCGRQSSN